MPEAVEGRMSGIKCNPNVRNKPLPGAQATADHGNCFICHHEKCCIECTRIKNDIVIEQHKHIAPSQASQSIHIGSKVIRSLLEKLKLKTLVLADASAPNAYRSRK